MKKKDKHVVEFVDDSEVLAGEDQSLLQASLGAGISHFHVCGGNAQCSTCRVLVLEGEEFLTPPNEKEKLLKSKMNFPPNIRLACQTHVTGGPVKLKRIIRDESDIQLYVGKRAGSRTQKLGREIELVVFFLDIRNFTSFVETHLAFDVIHIIRKLFDVFHDIIESHGGKIIETAGDGIYAAFGFGSEYNKAIDAAQQAVQAAYKILTDMDNLNETYFLIHFRQKMRIGIGIHIGKVIWGSIGLGKANHTVVMGYPVNIASRLQTATKELNNDLLISEEIYNTLSDPPPAASESITLKGVSSPFTVYLLGRPYSPANA